MSPPIESYYLLRSDLIEVRDSLSSTYNKNRHRFYLNDDSLWKGYEEILERSFGKMDSSSPTKGFICNDVAVAFVFVMHCEKTTRTAVLYNVSAAWSQVEFIFMRVLWKTWMLMLIDADDLDVREFGFVGDG